MNEVNCLIVDDEELARELIESHLSQLDGFNIIASCASAIEASAVLKSQHVDLMFLDIEMPVLKGTDFYRNLLNKPNVIFTTAYRDYAVDGFELDAVDYLLKPIVFARFFQAIERFTTARKLPTPASTSLAPQTEGTARNHIFVRINRKMVKLVLDDIVYVQSLKDYVQVHLKNESHIIKHGISSFKELLGEGFLRTHRSYIVNQSKVTALTKNDLELGNIEVPIGENYRESVSKVFETS